MSTTITSTADRLSARLEHLIAVGLLIRAVCMALQAILTGTEYSPPTGDWVFTIDREKRTLTVVTSLLFKEELRKLDSQYLSAFCRRFAITNEGSGRIKAQIELKNFRPPKKTADD